MKKLLIIPLAVSLLAVTPVFAQEPAPTGTMPPGAPKPPLRMLREKAELEKQKLQEKRQEFKQDKLEFKQKLQETNTGIREDRREFREGVIGERKEMKAGVMDALKNASSTEERRSILKAAQEERAAFRERVKSEWESNRLEFKGRRDALKGEAQDMAAERARGIMHRLMQSLERFEEMLTKIDTRIETLASEGVDTTDASAKADAAGTALDDATEAVEEAKVAIEEAAASETPKEEMDAVRAAVRTAVDDVKAAHAALKEALEAIKAASEPAAGDAETQE